MIEFDWLIHYTCNYRCPYCFFEGMWDEVERRNVYHPAETWIEAWRRVYDRYGEHKIIITGGEPVIFPGFAKMLTELSRFAYLAFDSNFSYRKDELLPVLDNVDPRRIFMGLSFHPVFAKLDEFMEKTRVLKERGFDFRVHFVTYPEQLHLLKPAQEAFTSAGIRFTPIPFRGMYKGKPYPESFTPEEKECIYGVTREIEKIDRDWADNQVVQVRSRDKLCRAGQHYARVDNDGSVYPCGNDYTKSREKYLLGNILDPEFRMKDEPMVCRQETCPCEFRWIVEDGSGG